MLRCYSWHHHFNFPICCRIFVQTLDPLGGGAFTKRAHCDVSMSLALEGCNKNRANNIPNNTIKAQL